LKIIMRFGGASRFAATPSTGGVANDGAPAKGVAPATETADLADRIRAVIDEASVRATVATSVELESHINRVTAAIDAESRDDAEADAAAPPIAATAPPPPNSPAPPLPLPPPPALESVRELDAPASRAEQRRRRAAQAPPSGGGGRARQLRAQHSADLAELERFERALDDKIAALKAMKRSLRQRKVQLRDAFEEEQESEQPKPRQRRERGRARAAPATSSQGDSSSSVRRGTYFGAFPTSTRIAARYAAEQ
jgi:hypothetical protein